MATGDNSAGALKAFIERIETLEEEKKDLGSDIREVYKEAKDNGWETKIMRKIVARRKMSAAERRTQDQLVDTYSAALGMTAEEEDAEDESGGD